MTVHIIISGFVQGVGFRWFVKDNADRLKISGWIKNNPNGNIEVLFSGASQSVKEMVDLCRQGPPGSEVKNVIIEEREEQASEGFKILSSSV